MIQPQPPSAPSVYRLTIGAAAPHVSLGRFPFWWLVLFAPDDVRVELGAGPEPDLRNEPGAEQLALRWTTELERARNLIDRRMAWIRGAVAERWGLTVEDLALTSGWWDQLVFLRACLPDWDRNWEETAEVAADLGMLSSDELGAWIELQRDFCAAVDRADATIFSLVALWARTRHVSPLGVGPEWIGQSVPVCRPPAVIDSLPAFPLEQCRRSLVRKSLERTNRRKS